MDENDIKQNFPFLTILKHQIKEYICIVQNSDENIISFYDFNSIKTQAEKEIFLQLGDTWWWESNRMLPISVFLPNQMKTFQYCLKTILRKDAEVVVGPCTSLQNIIQKRIKRRQISLIRKIV
jgi:hypothetical protein